MRALTNILLGIILAAASLVLLSRARGFAEDFPEDDTPKFGQGLILATPEALRRVPEAPTYRAFLPKKVDLTRYFPKPGNQGAQGSCTAWAVGYAARAYYAMSLEHRNIALHRNIPSPAFIYDTALKEKDEANCNTGSAIISALEVLKKGSLSLSAFPYLENSCRAPSLRESSKATDFRIDSYLRIELLRDHELDDIKGELAEGNPVVIAFQDSVDFQMLRAGHIFKARPDKMLGWHALAVVGYDERKQAFKIINSWGRKWADRGFAWIDYGTFLDRVREAYTMRLTAPPSPTPKPSPAPVPKPKPVPIVVPPPIVLPALKCAEVRVEEHNGRTVITGFVGYDEDLDRIRAIATNADLRVSVRPWPQCEALQTLDKALGSHDRPTVKIRRLSGDTLTEGDELVFEIETPSYPSYLNVAYIQADGSVVNLVQTDIAAFKTYPPRSHLFIGNEPNSKRRFRVSKPFGREMLIALASRSPVFPEALPKQETEREFLTALRRALIGMESGREISAAYDAITTIERGAP